MTGGEEAGGKSPVGKRRGEDAGGGGGGNCPDPKKGYDESSLRDELTEMMVTVIRSSCRRSSRSSTHTVQMWPEFLRNHRAQNSGNMKNILALLKLAMVIPVSTAEAESKVTSGHVCPQKLSVIL